jgi:hypothetical protein
MIKQSKIEKIVYWIGFHFTSWILTVSIVMLSWNYLCAEFFGAEKLTIGVATGLLIIKNILFMPNKSEKEEPQIKTFN